MLRAKRATPRRNEGRVQHVRLKPLAKSAPTALEAKHIARIVALGCCVTGQPGVCHHIMKAAGKIRRRDHRLVVCLTPALHNMATDSVHLLGSEAKFEVHHGLEAGFLALHARMTWARSCEMFGGE